MQMITFKDVVFKGKSLFKCLIERDMSLEEALKIYGDAIIALQNSTSLDQVKLSELGLKSSCKLTYENLLTEILNTMIVTNATLSSSVSELSKKIANMINSVATVADEKVKASSKDTTPGFLADKLFSAQSGSIKYADDKVTLIGFVPLGAVMFINKSRLVDFDGTGKGKTGTDLWGWAICNGNNGTENRLKDSFPKYPSDIADAGKAGGASTATLTEANIPTLDLVVSGTISDKALFAQPDIKFKVLDFHGGALGDGHTSLDNDVPTANTKNYTMKTEKVDLTHNHNFDLRAKRVNSSVSPVQLNPKYIYEVPIQRISVEF